MTEAVMELMNCMISLLRKQQAYLKEAMALLQDICQDMHQLMEQSQKDEVKIRELQEQIRKWKIFCSDLSEQNEVLVKQNQELQGLKELWMPGKEFEASTNSLSRKEISGKEAAASQDMTREELLAALARGKQETRSLYTQKISLRQLSARLNEENEMLLTLWEEMEQKYENAKSAYDDLWKSYEQMRGLYESAREKIRELQKEKCTAAGMGG